MRATLSKVEERVESRCCLGHPRAGQPQAGASTISSTPRQKARDRHHWPSFLSSLLVSGALAWLGWLVARDWHEFARVLTDVNFGGLALVLLLGLLANLPNGFLFWWQLRHIEERPVSLLFSARMLFIGQVIRYLPGRIWHLVYQASVTHQILPKSILIRVNLEYMSVITWAALGVSLTILATHVSVGIALCICLCTILGLVLGFRFAWHMMLLGLLANLLPRGRVHDSLTRIGAPSPRAWSSSLVVLGVVTCIWGCYIGGWLMLGIAWPTLARLDLAYLCAVYTLAWFIGFVSMLAPGGIGVRELAFASMAPDVPSETLVLLMLIVRVWLTLVEVLLFFAVLPVSERGNRNDPPNRGGAA